MAGLMTRIEYESDDGFAYAVRQDASNATAAGNTAAVAVGGLPGRYRPRYVLAQSPTTGRERKVVIGDPTNAVWVGGTTTLSLPDFNNAMAAQTFVIRGRIGEKRFAV